MNISIFLDEEQSGALAQLVSEYNARRDTPVSTEQYLENVLTDSINARVRQNFRAVVEALGNAAAPLPYSARQQLIATVQAALTE